jgi:hypothetical protein
MKYLPFLLIFSIYSTEVKFHKTHETLDKIEEIITHRQKGAYFRFGDGDVNLAYGENDSYQATQGPLRQEMLEAFALNGPTVLKTLPLYCNEFNGWEEGMFPGNHEGPYWWCMNILTRAEKIWSEPVTDVYSHAALAFAATNYPQKCIEFLAFLRAQSPCLFVGNKNVPSAIRELLFGSSCIFIPTPANNSYKEIDRIERQCLEALQNQPGYKIIITAMGCSGRALQKRLWNQCDDIFLFDFGSLIDSLCGWNTRAWMELTHLNGEEFIQKLEKRTL